MPPRSLRKAAAAAMRAEAREAAIAAVTMVAEIRETAAAIRVKAKIPVASAQYHSAAIVRPRNVLI